jgi:hypothetical protein
VSPRVLDRECPSGCASGHANRCRLSRLTPSDGLCLASFNELAKVSLGEQDAPTDLVGGHTALVPQSPG